jgi:MFS family permease
MVTTRRTFLVSLCIGSLIGMIPLLLKVRRDPFDAPSSYAVWGIGFLLAGFIVAFLKPQEAWRGAFGVGIGLAVSLGGARSDCPRVRQSLAAVIDFFRSRGNATGVRRGSRRESAGRFDEEDRSSHSAGRCGGLRSQGPTSPGNDHVRRRFRRLRP